MNKIGFVLGVATVATLAGCLDPSYKSKRTPQDTPVVPKETVEEPVTPVRDVPDAKPADVVATPVITEVSEPVAPPPKKIDATPAASTQPTAVASAPATTTYIVQRGDTLAKISKRFNIKIDAIKAANPQIKGDVIKLGQRLALPGNVDVGEQTVPEGAIAPVKRTVKEFKPYEGATKEIVVKSGDTLGGLAVANGVTVRQLKQMNGLDKDIIRVGQKLVVPADKAKTTAAAPQAEKKPVAEKKPAFVKAESAPAPQAPAEVPAPAEAAAPAPAPEEAPVTVAEAVPAPEAAPAADENKYFTYTVSDGEDITGISINFDVSPSEIRQLNNLGEDAPVTPGMKLKLPLPTQQ